MKKMYIPEETVKKDRYKNNIFKAHTERKRIPPK